MRLRSVVVFALAILFGGVAVAAAKVWLEGQRQLLLGQGGVEVNTIVVAAAPLRFGDLLQNSNLKQIPWPAGSLPKGAFGKIKDFLKDGDRYVMSAIEADEPVFGWKVTGGGQRATLSAAIDAGMKAVTIRVNDVLGVAGFVLPGDRVDVLLTRAKDNNGDSHSYVDVLLQGVKVLAIDQTADDRRDKPAVVKAVTFEVNTEQAQKLTLAAKVGQLSLALRNIAAASNEVTKRVTVTDLELNAPPPPPPAPIFREAAFVEVKPSPPPAPVDQVIGVYRNLQRSEYRVKPGS